MRNTFANTFLQIARKDKRLILLTGDLGFSVFEELMEELPEQYINCGMIEQTMTGIAAGLASEGFLPVIYSIVPFITMRNFEQIRNDICYQNLPVLIVGIGAGYSYGPYGHTHHGIEDIAILRTLPNLRLFTPGDPLEVEQLTNIHFNIPAPTYLRIGKKGEPILHNKPTNIELGKPAILQRGEHICILACSTMVQTAVIVGSDLKNNYSQTATIVSVPTLKPINEQLLINITQDYPLVVTIEESSLIGGLGSMIAEIFTDNTVHTPLLRVGVPDTFSKYIGPQEQMKASQGLTSTQITTQIVSRLEEIKKIT